MVLIDVGDGIEYESHPEISVKNAWTHAKLKKELAKIRSMGLEPIPKLNFSTSHDVWLGPYSRCVSTDTYYGVCRDIIAEVIKLFNKPRFFHIGMDEETAKHQKNYNYVVIRQHELWWHDFYFLVKEVEKRECRSWIWSDYIWNHQEEFLRKMPKSVLQSNWYYGKSFSKKISYVNAYHLLEKYGYDQVPTGSNHCEPENFGKTVSFARKYISQKHLKGFLQTPWRPTLPEFKKHHLEAIDVVGNCIS